MDTKKFIPIILAAVIAGGGGFWGGTAYQTSKQPASAAALRGAGNGGFAGRGQGGAGFRNGGARGAGFVGGEVLSKDDKTVTVKLQDGGSKIVLFSASSTKVYRSSEVQADAIAVGDQVIVNGTPNDDGSVTASMIQIRPPMQPAPAPGQAPAPTPAPTK